MKKSKQTNERPQAVKRRFYSALCMLLISAILLTTTSFAWLIMSTAPEVTGIATNIGANGSLEIALLTSETRQNLDSIKTTVGQSLVNNKTAANNTWGNLIDLNDSSYGLSNITLMPTRLNVEKSGDKYVVDSGLLSIPTYGYDGRIIDIDQNAISAVYQNKEFSTVVGMQDYGVRAVGTSNTLSVQGSALALAKSNIVTYTNSAKNGAAAAMTNNIDALMDMVLAHSANSSATYDDGDLDTLLAMIQDLQGAAGYIDLTLRQGLVAYAASELGDEGKFTAFQSRVMDTENTLSGIIADREEVTTVPAEFIQWVDALKIIQNNLSSAVNTCNTLKTDGTGTYTWAQLRSVLDIVMDLDGIYIGEKLFSNMSAQELMDLMGSDFTMTLGPASGVFAQIADFTGDYSAWISMMGSDVEIKTLTQVKPVYLVALAEKVKELESADGSTAGETKVTLTATYGYAVDLAFRCNAAISDLLLQTDASQRIYDTSAAPSTMGGGSYMEFSTADPSFSLEQQIKLMDAVRVGFVDDQGNLLGVAKLNVSNRSVIEDVVRAPLYLYDFSISEEEEDYGAMIIGERRKTDNTIVSLTQNVAKAITVVVWLDGDLVDNTMVSAEEETSLNGILNLQFASSADLIPADNSELLHLSPDKTALQELVDTEKAVYDQGGAKYTALSWMAYAEAYEYAAVIAQDSAANDTQVYMAAMQLTKAKLALTELTLDALKTKIEEMRQFMGQTQDLARYVLENTEDQYFYSVNPYTQEQKDQKVGEIYRVDYTMNLHDEGNGVMTPIYTDASWSNLAAALYDAEVLYKFNKYTDDQEIDSAITALETAYNSLERRVYYIPYDYEGTIYYFAISDEKDTYGKWYDADFKRVVSDLKILELDAKAELVDIAQIVQDAYVLNNVQAIGPYVEILSELYPNLSNEEILAIHWNTPENFTAGVTSSQIAYIRTLMNEAKALNIGNTEITAAETLLAKYQMRNTNASSGSKDYYDVIYTATKEEAETVIENLETVIAAEEERLAQEEAAAIDPAVAPMTLDQRTVLTAAVNAAKTAEGYDSTEQPDPEDATAVETAQKLAELKLAVEAVEKLLTMETGATMKLADEALDALNDRMVAVGLKEVNAYNTLLHTIPVGSEIFEVTNFVDFSSTMLYTSTDTVRVTIEARVLTRNGILFTAVKNVAVYARAEGTEFSQPATLPAGGAWNETTNEDGQTIQVWNQKIQAAQSVGLSVKLLQATYTKEITEGEGEEQIVVGTEEVPYAYGESISRCEWSSDDLEILTVTGDNAGNCTITAVREGTTTIHVSVYTVQGNVYTTSITITVTG